MQERSHNRRSLVLVHLGSQFGGVDVYMDNLGRLLLECAEVVGIASHPLLLARFRSAGVISYGIPKRVHNRKVLRTLLLPFLLWSVVRRHKTSLIVLNDHAESLFIVPGKLLGCNVYAVAHGVLGLHSRSLFQLLGRFFYKNLANLADGVICVSQSVRAAQSTVVEASKLHVVYNWLPVLPQVVVKDLRGLNSPLSVLFVGRLEHVKGAHLLLEALKNVPGVRLTIVGDGSERHHLEKLADGMSVTFAGFQKETEPFYQQADLFVNPALDEGIEGMPFVSLEAMAHGLPCIFSATPVHKEITEAGTSAKLFSPGDVSSLKIALRELLSDDSHREQLGLRARLIVEKRHQSSTALEAFKTLFQL